MKKVIILMTSLLLATSLYAADKSPLTLKVYNADSNSFHANSTLVYGETEAVVIDAGFTKADALKIAANIFDSGKKLTTIFISQADPDFYFGAETLHKIFPEAKVLTTPAVAEVIESKMQGKLAFWGPKMGTNGPKKPLLPESIKQNELMVDGYKIEIKGTTGVLAHRPYVWIPSQKALVGNIAVFGGLHVWTADNQTQDKLDAWLTQLTQMQNLAPKMVVPGHMQKGTNLDANNINYTISYLNTFIQEKKNSKNAEELINKMKLAYPDAQLPLALSIGAKVHMGEMKW